ncbi:raffinose/stachyose/melibiose transport system permease protein [Deinococcus metalli]|uniref:Raffinose/stachyose/melibiose transport system permease protein n=1 Tax=Deinococcus metalli TaxID=1141878 RepID=A0A7W8KHS7_9DEIO|nr:sugar ABC transporter permease [Deinococcus metalli]MBB5376769.1 raffinose/stachyose/melibiose transport system permease protein [Deinococcus metalli]GHF45217.1 sugar ABC transporter permease [Deinococcus metalli]
MTSQDTRPVPGVSRAPRTTQPAPPRHLPPWAWAVPAALLVLLARYMAAAAGGWYAFTDWNGLSPHATFTGAENFRQIFSDPAARGALLNTVKFAACFVVLTNIIGLCLAVALNQHLRTRFLLRTVFFAPVVMSQLATAFIWRFLFDYSGPINGALDGIGLGALKKTWLANPTWSFWAVVIVLVWQFSGLAMVVLLAGLQGIAQEVEEAAQIDGATSWQRLIRITLPLLAPALAISIQLSVISGLAVFDQVMALTGGGPLGATETLATQVYKQTFVFGRYGYGTALALLLTVLIAGAALIQQLVTRRLERESA